MYKTSDEIGVSEQVAHTRPGHKSESIPRDLGLAQGIWKPHRVNNVALGQRELLRAHRGCEADELQDDKGTDGVENAASLA